MILLLVLAGISVSVRRSVRLAKLYSLILARILQFLSARALVGSVVFAAGCCWKPYSESRKS